MKMCSPWFQAAAIAELLLSTLQLARAQTADAPGGEPNLSHADQVVTVARQGYTICGLVTRLGEAKAIMRTWAKTGATPRDAAR
jgi:hypothetical protein